MESSRSFLLCVFFFFLLILATRKRPGVVLAVDRYVSLHIVLSNSCWDVARGVSDTETRDKRGSLRRRPQGRRNQIVHEDLESCVYIGVLSTYLLTIFLSVLLSLRWRHRTILLSTWYASNHLFFKLYCFMISFRYHFNTYSSSVLHASIYSLLTYCVLSLTNYCQQWRSFGEEK